MLVTMCEDYDQFVCTAGNCKHNCCLGGWEIEIDEETVEKYRNLEGSFGEKLRNSVQQIPEACFRLEEGKCPFLKEDGLCQVYCELGESYMGRVCREFPRFMEYFGEEKEMGLGLACEEVGRMLFSKIGKTKFVTREMPSDICYETEPVDEVLYEFLKQVRDQSISLLQDRGQDLYMQCCKVLALSQMVQQAINDGSYTKLDITKISEEELLKEVCMDREDSLPDRMLQLLYDCSEFAVLEKDWESILQEMIKHVQEETWQEDTKAMLKAEQMLDIQYEQLLVYYVFRYFTHAVYDNNLLDKAKFMAVSFVLIREMNVVMWKKEHTLTLENQIECNRIFARQMEYSQDNMDAFSDMFLFGEDYAIQNIQKLILI